MLDSLLSIVDTIARSNDALYSITSYRERKRQQYADGLSYNEVKKLKLTKKKLKITKKSHLFIV